jgi:FKBP-type peptidyl-prolyl cis-trans isomerase SlyD
MGLLFGLLYHNSWTSITTSGKTKYNRTIRWPTRYHSQGQGDVQMSDALTVQDGQIVSMDYTLHVDGEIIDASEENEPLEFLQGAGNIIPGLENALYGMSIGESKQVTVAAGEGYGELDTEAFADVPRDDFPSEIPLEEGLEIEVTDQAGNPMYARVDCFDDETVTLDFNHPLAGKTLNFEVKIVALRAASPEELEHGHAHGAEFDDEDEDELED